MIYIIQAGPHGGPIKVGWTTQNPWARLDALQTGNPYKLRLIAFLEDWPQSQERVLHSLLAPVRLEGEWFAWSDLTERFVRAVLLEQSGVDYSAMSEFITHVTEITDGMARDEKERRLAVHGIGLAPD